MKEFKPSFYSIPYTRIVGYMSGMLFGYFLFDVASVYNWVFTSLIILYLGFEVFNYFYLRYVQIINHRRLKSYGLATAWLYLTELHSKISEIEFMHMWEASLSNKVWHSQFLYALSNASFCCMQDIIVKPFKIRWRFKLAIPIEWSEDEVYCAVITLFTGLPDNQPWRIYRNVDNIVIESYMYEVQQNVNSIEDAPEASLLFWSIFRNDLICLLDARWEFTKPKFENGVVEHIWFELPAKFPLTEGGYLVVSSDNELLKVTSFDINHISGETVYYKDIPEFWCVWRYAIQDAFDKLNA